ncbi:palmitoyltransferase ZDHHC21-like [Physella acuta]|uniref:palmitoyltransferase ZDHHC21-like n=1 Tax=Physella acuta TaxID=109671 RepID=UPI0027DCAC05|nr:palmitoyltransferase ZDHHC21-like [Physella acuta]
MSSTTLLTIDGSHLFHSPSAHLVDRNDSNNNSIKLPIFGRVHIVKDKEGHLCALFVVAYWVYGTLSTLCIAILPACQDGHLPYLFAYVFVLISAMCILSFLRASLTNPGQLPYFTGSETDAADWNECRSCHKMRPPRAHHCRRCKQCVMRMDHHCPWINNCVGENNHFAFLQLLFYACLLSTSAFVFVLLHFWVFPKCHTCNQELFYIKHSIWFMYLTFLLSLNMMFMMAVQFCQQHFNVIINKTTLESMIERDYKNIRAGQCYSSYRRLCGQGLPIFWLCPIGPRRPMVSYDIL